MKKKILVSLLSFVMVVTMMPLSVFANTANTEKGGANEPIPATELPVGATVNLPKEDASTVQFTVLDQHTSLGAEGAFLFAKSKLGEGQYNATFGQVQYDGSKADLWCQQFYSTLSADLRNQIVQTSKQEEVCDLSSVSIDTSCTQGAASNMTSKSVFLLSAKELFLDGYKPNIAPQKDLFTRTSWNNAGQKEKMVTGYYTTFPRTGLYAYSSAVTQSLEYWPALNMAADAQFELQTDGTYTWVKPAGKITVTFSSTGKGGYYDEDGNTVTALDFEKNTTFKVTDVKDGTKTIDFAEPSGNAIKLTVRPDEGSVIESFTPPQSPITSACEFNTTFGIQQIRVGLESSSVAGGSGEFYCDGKEVSEVSVPYGTTFTTEKYAQGNYGIKFNTNPEKVVIVSPAESSIITNLETPQSPIISACNFTAEFTKTATVTFSKQEVGGATGNYYLDEAPITSLVLPVGTTYTVTDISNFYRVISFSTGQNVDVYANFLETGSIIASFEGPESPIKGDCSFETIFGTNAVISFEKACEGEADGEINDAQGQPVTSFSVPAGTTYEIKSLTPDEGEYEIAFYDNDGKLIKDIYAIADQYSVVDSIDAPLLPVILGNTSFKVNFAPKDITLNLTKNEYGAATGRYLDADLNEITEITVPAKSTYTVDKTGDHLYQITFSNGEIVFVVADYLTTGAYISNFIGPESPILEEGVFWTEFRETEYATVNFVKDEQEGATGEFYDFFGEPIEKLEVPVGTGYTLQYDDPYYGYDIVFDNGWEVYVKAGEGSMISQLESPKSPITGTSTFKAQFVPESFDVLPIEGFDAHATGSSEVLLSWEQAKMPRVQYFVYKGETPTGDWGPAIAVLPNDQTTWSDYDVEIGGTYYYMLRPAIQKADGSYVFGPYTKVDYGKPAIPKINDFEAWAPTHNLAKVEWAKSADPKVEYFLYKGAEPTGDWGPYYQKLDNNTTTFTDENVQTNTKAYYMLRAGIQNADGTYSFGPYTKVDYAYPRVMEVSGFRAWAPDATHANLAWDEPKDSNIVYFIYKGKTPTGDWGPCVDIVSDHYTTTWSDPDAQTGVKAYYMVRPAIQNADGSYVFGPYTKVDYAWPR